eukprot:57163-Rhodomonas_salina.1
MVRAALSVKEVCARHAVPLLINDRLDVALVPPPPLPLGAPCGRWVRVRVRGVCGWAGGGRGR